MVKGKLHVGRYFKYHVASNQYDNALIAYLIFYTGILAYLLDAYHENEYLDSNGVQTAHTKLRLHPALAPVKVAIFSHDRALNIDLSRVARQLATELRQAGNAVNTTVKWIIFLLDLSVRKKADVGISPDFLCHTVLAHGVVSRCRIMEMTSQEHQTLV
jgi:hypothetical protein